MGKRKANIFSGTDSLTNWTETSSHNLTSVGRDLDLTNLPSSDHRLGEQLRTVGPASTEANTGRPIPVQLPRVGEPADPLTAHWTEGDVAQVEVGPSEPEAQGVGTPDANQLEATEWEVRQAFWDLLQADGYEVWGN